MNKTAIDIDAEREALAIKRLDIGRVQLPKRICRVRTFHRIYTDSDWRRLIIKTIRGKNE